MCDKKPEGQLPESRVTGNLGTSAPAFRSFERHFASRYTLPMAKRPKIEPIPANSFRNGKVRQGCRFCREAGASIF
jgi:hypothetical protein